MQGANSIKKAVFLYSTPSSGHKRCADAVRAVLDRRKEPQVKTVGLDAIRYLYPFLGSLISKTYVEIIKHTPQIWDFLYDNPDIAEITRELRQIFSFLDTPKLKALLTEYRPDVFVCTHAVPSSLIAEQKRRGNCDLPVVAIVTDYDVHSYWAHPEVDLYIVANDKSKKTLEARGVQEKRIRVCGIPVDPAFSKKIPQKQARKRLGMELDTPAVLVMGGTQGLGGLDKVVETLLNLKPSPQILVVAGINKELASELEPYKETPGIHVFGFTNQIPLLMDASDLLITKPGGLTSSEAMVKGLPMVLINPIPGQEDRNSRYLLKNAGAQKVRDLKDLKEKVGSLLDDPSELRKISQKMLKIATPRAAEEAAGEIASILRAEALHETLRAD